ncbi:hypothetical protein GMB86_07515 [Terrilactibacillus sp. BCM23-1]|uniref:Polysaccharide chain length determinant N-terminal domain-containing protein n=1 Tax=Terrilactibacillus tamarindi TaxID=2599694 RepID=A0A6N8CRN4_9BACI|nr:hypothetical protein [Terrilactibacillus tamarindi]MTT31857.1 hypothetical protein [Terrilactibacillus tamarindi]
MNSRQRIITRSKKYMVLIIVIPILLGLIGYFYPNGKSSSSYTAEASISLGNYHDPDLNNTRNVESLLTNEPFYKENLPYLKSEEQDRIINQLKVTIINDKTIQLSYTDTPKSLAIETVNRIMKAFLALDTQKYKQKEKVIQNTIHSLKKNKVGPDALVDKERFLYKLESTQLTMSSAAILKSVDHDQRVTSVGLNSKSRATLGVLIGITIVFVWVTYPEIFRTKPKEKEE